MEAHLPNVRKGKQRQDIEPNLQTFSSQPTLRQQQSSQGEASGTSENPQQGFSMVPKKTTFARGLGSVSFLVQDAPL